MACLLGSTAVALALPGLAQAQMRWDGSAGTDWNNGDNWNTSLAPTAGSNPIVSGPAPAMPVISGGTTSLGILFVGYDNGLGGAELTITGGASLTTSSASIGEQSINNAGNARETESGLALLSAGSSWNSSATGLDVRLSNAVSLGARFDAELSQNNQSYSGAATLKVRF